MIKYLPECFVTALLFVFGFQAINFYRDETSIKISIDALTTLQKSVAELHAETITLGFNYKSHNDRQAQLQLQLDNVMRNQSLDTNLLGSVRQFNQEILRYTQLASMLKTSRRFISQAYTVFANSNPRTQQVGERLLAQLMTYSSPTNRVTADTVKNYMTENWKLLNQIDDPIIKWPMLEKHIVFVLNNSQPELLFLNNIQPIAIENKISEHIYHKSNELNQAYYRFLIYTVLVVVSLLSFLFLIFYRQYQQLQIKTAQAEQANEIKSQFLANMSHEIRTPINGILGLTDLCLETTLSDKQKSYLSNIKLSVRSLMTIVNDVLDFSKIESNKLQIETIGFDLFELIEHCKITVNENANEKGLEFITHIQPDCPQGVMGDPVRWQQIILNLLSNAIKFTEKGRVSLDIRAINDEKELNAIEISVSDTGIGLTDAQSKQLFKRFIQAESSTTRKYGGTGLGLAICKELIDLMGGNITVNSTKGKGTCFVVTLPCKEFELDSTPSPTEELTVLDTPSESQILLVEDNPVNQMIAMEIINSMGYTVHLAENGLQAIEKIEHDQYDLVFMDIQMPEMDGMTATRSIRKTHSIEELPIVALTANVMSHEVEEYYAIGMNACVGKPFDIDQIKGTITQYCG